MHHCARIAGRLALLWFLAVPAFAQVGSDGSVADTGGPLRDPGALPLSSGPVYESRLPTGLFPRPRFSGVPVSTGGRGVYGDGCLSDASRGSVADIGWSALPLGQVPFDNFAESDVLPPAENSLTAIMRSIRPLPRATETDSERTAEEEVSTGSGTEGSAVASAENEPEPAVAEDQSEPSAGEDEREPFAGEEERGPTGVQEDQGTAQSGSLPARAEE